mmetsp:Transcript_28128/g.65713  ORF Transcript_28128/g.65713 Transcript_28128/m.65713 type:complete len:247 (+) Transcript_28128:194-934(+)
MQWWRRAAPPSPSASPHPPRLLRSDSAHARACRCPSELTPCNLRAATARVAVAALWRSRRQAARTPSRTGRLLPPSSSSRPRPPSRKSCLSGGIASSGPTSAPRAPPPPHGSPTTASRSTAPQSRCRAAGPPSTKPRARLAHPLAPSVVRTQVSFGWALDEYGVGVPHREPPSGKSLESRLLPVHQHSAISRIGQCAAEKGRCWQKRRRGVHECERSRNGEDAALARSASSVESPRFLVGETRPAT